MWELSAPHPAVVHFPIGLAVAAALLDVVARLHRRATPLSTAALLLHVLALATAIGAYRTGLLAEAALRDVPALAQGSLRAHLDLARWASVALGITVWLKAGASLAGMRWPRLRTVGQTAGIAAGVAAAALVLVAGHRGGVLVYTHGLGVPRPRTAPAPSKAALLRDAPPMAPFDHGVTPLGLVPLAGTEAAVEGLAVTNDGGAAVRLRGRAILVLPGAYGDVEIRADLDVGKFTGTVGLVHHAQAPDSLDAFVLSGDEARLTRVEGGEAQVLDLEQVLPLQGLVHLSVSATGSQAKGRCDGEVVVQGQAPPLPPGRCGLLLDGRGTILVRSAIATSVVSPPATIPD